MINRNKGFTMIELIIVIVILGILAAVAMPKFVDLSGEAKQASVNAVAAAAGSASVINYGGCSALNHTATANKCVLVRNCTEVEPLLIGGAFPTGHSTTNPGANVTTNGTEISCTVTYATKTATFIAITSGNP